MPTISSFYGIVIRMFVKDHPPPHVHVRYGEHRARVAIATGEMLDGDLPRRAERLVGEWIELRRPQPEENWRRIERMELPDKVEPLP